MTNLVIIVIALIAYWYAFNFFLDFFVSKDGTRRKWIDQQIVAVHRIYNRKDVSASAQPGERREVLQRVEAGTLAVCSSCSGLIILHSRENTQYKCSHCGHQEYRP